MRNLRWLALLALVLASGCGLFPIQSRLAFQSEEGSEFVVKCYETLEKYFYDPTILKHPKFFNAGLEGLSKALKLKGIEFTPNKIPDNATPEKAKQIFCEEFAKAERLCEGKDFKKHELTFITSTAMLDCADDSHTDFIWPEAYEVFKKELSGEVLFAGIGTRILKLENGYFYFDEIFLGTPAERAGLKRFDRLISVNGKKAENLIEIVSWVRGVKGTEVMLEIERQGQLLRVKVMRDNITIPTSKEEIYEKDGKKFGYFKLYQFDRNAAEALFNHIKKAEADGGRGIIIDLRGNSGGFINILHKMLSSLLKIRTVIMVTESRGRTNRLIAMDGPITDLPIVILINEHSFSASEIFSAVMQENGRARIVGTKSIGSVSVGMRLDLPHGAGMGVTVAQLKTGKGTKLEKVGVTPDFPVELTKEDILKAHDSQLEKAKEALR